MIRFVAFTFLQNKYYNELALTRAFGITDVKRSSSRENETTYSTAYEKWEVLNRTRNENLLHGNFVLKRKQNEPNEAAE